MLELKLFGTGQAHFKDQCLADFPGQQSSLLFCHLLLNRHYPHHREVLSTIFWGDSSTSTARKRLRNALWRLRKQFQSSGIQLEEYLLIADDTISFINTSAYWLDIEIFETAAESCEDLSGRQLTTTQVENLEKAVELYRGDLLESLYEDWLLNDRERLRILYLNALDKLLVYHGLHANYERGLAYGEDIITRDCTREKVHRQMMWLHALAGNRNAALTQYRRCCLILQDELGIPPMEETQNMYQLLLQNQFDAKTWQADELTPIRPAPSSDPNIHPLVRRALQKLHHLQETIEGTSVELQAIEQMIHQALVQSNQNHKNIPD